MVLTVLVLIHRCFFAKNKETTQSPASEETQIERKKEEESVEGSFQPRNEIVSYRGHLAPSQPQPLPPTNHRSNFSLDFAIVAICRFSTSLLAAPIQRAEEDPLRMSIEDKFRAAVRVIHSLPKDGPYQPSNSTKLKFYGLYKQATEGKNTTTQPRFWDVIGRAKWEAWNKLGDISKEDAMNQYVDCLKEIVETMSFNGDVEDFLDSIGPFYEFVTLQGNEMNHIKEKIEEVTSSSSNSSLAASLNNSKQSSPVKELSPKIQAAVGDEEEEQEEEEASTSETAEVSVETTSASYETKAGKSYSSHNGTAFKMPNGQRHVTYGDTAMTIPPPAPTHSYSHQNGYVKHLNQDDDEVLTVSASPVVSCKEDLEHDIEEEGRTSAGDGHPRVKVTSSIETVATSGTESEKYYSGDSEPEMDDKLIASSTSSSYPATATTSSNLESYPSTSMAALQQQLYQAQRNNAVNIPTKKVKSSRVSTSASSSSAVVSKPDAADLAVQQTVERLNRDVDHILARLRILEAVYASNAEVMRTPSGEQSSSNSRRKSRIFGGLSPQSIAFIVMWPFVVQFLIKLIRWWWRRRRLASSALRSIAN